MSKKFKSKKKGKKHFFSKFIIIGIIVYLTYQLISNVFISFKLTSNNDDFLKAMINDFNHHLLYEKKANNIINKMSNVLMQVDFSKPLTIVEQTFNVESSKTLENNKKNDLDEVINNIDNYVKDPNPVKTEKPRVYLYNSHQGENYSNKNLEAHNITPNVLMASYLLKEKLNKLNIPTIVEETNLLEFIRINNWTHNESYEASRIFLIDTLNKHPNLDLIIDIHRDGISKEASTVTIDGKDYAKILLVIGKTNENYKKNQELSNKINSIVNQKYPGLSRGLFYRGGAGTGVTAIYNQDVNPKMILLEIGGQDNTIEEVLNTVEAMSHVIKEFLE